MEAALRAAERSEAEAREAVEAVATLQRELGEARSALKAAEKEARGDRHPHTLTSIHNLAGLLEDQGKLDEAEPLSRWTRPRLH